MSRLCMGGISACFLLISVGAARAEKADVNAAQQPKVIDLRPVTAANSAESEAVTRIRQALDEKTKFDFNQVPLDDALAFLGDYHKIEILLDTRSLEEASIGSETPVTGQRQNVALHSALRSLLRPIDLTYIIQDEALVITTPDKAQNTLVTKVYPVGDLLGSVHRPGVKGSNGYQPLLDVITATVAPTSWDEVGGPGSVQVFAPARLLVASQTEEAQEQIADLLTALRKARDAQPAPPPPTAMESFLDSVTAISMAWQRGRMMTGMTGTPARGANGFGPMGTGLAAGVAPQSAPANTPATAAEATAAAKP